MISIRIRIQVMMMITSDDNDDDVVVHDDEAFSNVRLKLEN